MEGLLKKKSSQKEKAAIKANKIVKINHLEKKFKPQITPANLE